MVEVGRGGGMDVDIGLGVEVGAADGAAQPLRRSVTGQRKNNTLHMKFPLFFAPL
jgi:hypothetical protein